MRWSTSAISTSTFLAPTISRYLLFGRDGEAHLSHYIARDPDFQHIVTLGSAPAWLSPDQLAASAAISLADVPSLPRPLRRPPEGEELSGAFSRVARMPGPRCDLNGASSVWFGAGDLLNQKDPCPNAASRS